MHAKQDNKLRIDTGENTESFIELPSPLSTNEPRQQEEVQPRQAAWRWLVAHSFSPAWLPEKFHHPITGYTVAILLQITAIFITSLLVQLYPSFMFTDLLEILAIALVALNWG